MNYPVVIKGTDIDSAIRMPDRLVKVKGGIYQQVKLCSIDMYNEPPVTRRKVTVEKEAPLTMSFIDFHMRLLNSSIPVGRRYSYTNDGYGDQPVKPGGGYYHANPRSIYPQKHIVDVEIKGANGANGFLPSAYLSNNPAPTVSSYVARLSEQNGKMIPTTLASLFNIYMRHKDYNAGDTIGSEGSALTFYNGNWQISEHDWWMYIAKESLANFTPTAAADCYTRACDFHAVLTELANGGTHSGIAMKLFKCLNLFYSDANIFTIRVTMELYSEYEKKITFEKFAQSQVQLT